LGIRKTISANIYEFSITINLKQIKSLSQFRESPGTFTNHHITFGLTVVGIRCAAGKVPTGVAMRASSLM
jgi:hypothetical protein